MKKITEIPASVLNPDKNTYKKLRIAAYCRVSTEKEEQENSLENQIAYYKDKIESNENWILVDIFSDFGISGMSDKNRPGFLSLIETCRKGKIDLIITKSISRFSRNTVDCLTWVRTLKALNIGIVFEKEGINTLDAISETFLTWFSAFAQAESESLSQNVTRGKRMGYKDGKFSFPYYLYGFCEGENGEPQIIPEQARIIQKIFHLYLEGYSVIKIKEWLDDKKIAPIKGGKAWHASTIMSLLNNEKFMGDVLLQKTYTVDYLTKTTAKNNGEVTQYYITDNHVGIVSKEIFYMVQNERKRRSSLLTKETTQRYSSQYALTKRVICGECGAYYKRVTWSKPDSKQIVWRCSERLNSGIKKCRHSPTIYENELHNVILNCMKEILNDHGGIVKDLRSELAATLHQNDSFNHAVINKKIKTYEKELKVLSSILKETDDKVFYANKIERLKSEIAILKRQSEALPTEKYDAALFRIDEFISSTELNMSEYFEVLVRNTIESVTIFHDKTVKIKFSDGYEVAAILNTEKL